MDTAPPSSPIFREEQHFRQWWVWLLLVVPAGVAWWLFGEQVLAGRQVGQNPGPDWAIWLVWVFIGLGLPLLFGFIALIVVVDAQAVKIRYRPFVRRTILMADIESAEARTYSPIGEYGGWGIRGWSRAKMAYNVRGNRGVELTLKDGRTVLLGSQRADELAAAIQSRRRPR